MMRTAEDNHKKEEFNEVEWSVDHSPHVSIPFILNYFVKGSVDMIVGFGVFFEVTCFCGFMSWIRLLWLELWLLT